ncbi:MAG: bifunctional pyr operon transcriptional regulator/uracil phosphoribosyltransferase PyrR [Candidatus Heimdallarchaeota archaeon]|nr:bifunctional pyr operon transcriptional regulator/uracil phosphoribosyltransferase PyrR [Candidatus Heimdallarchaeota archaeon]
MKELSKLMDAPMIKRTLMRISHEIIESNKGAEDLVIIGVQRRGAHLAKRIASMIKEIDGNEVLVGLLDITLYRDDLTLVAECPVVHSTEIKFDITGKSIVLVDDVLYTGRTVRCALDELTDMGRPKIIQLAVLVDRGHRELPIRADYVGKNVPTARNQCVELKLTEEDVIDELTLIEQGQKND